MNGLRDYQVKAIKEARKHYATGAKSILIVAPTGAGKTRIGVALVSSAIAKGGSCLWLAHRQELLQQAADSLRKEGQSPSIIAPWSPYNPSAPIQVASVQTLLARQIRPSANVLVLDEAHHHVADTWSTVAESYNGIARIGLTATPERQDGVGLGNLFDAMVTAAQPRDLIASRYLVEARVFAPKMRRKALSEDPIVAYRRWGEGGKAIVFVSSIKACRDLEQRFKTAGIPAKSITGAMDSADRDVAIDRFRSGSIRALIGVHTLTEGLDVPDASVCILARGFSYPGSYIQAIGRVMRPFPGKTHAIIIDLMGVSNDHGLPEDDREYSLIGAAIKNKSLRLAIIECRVCGRIYRSSEFVDSTCPSCGAVKKGRIDPKIRRAAMILQTEARVRALAGDGRVQALREFLKEAREKGRKQKSVLFRYKHRFGIFPNKDIMTAAGWR